MEKFDLCRCCLRRPPDRDMKIPYVLVGKPEIYADMLKECFEINLSKLSEEECGICNVCVDRLKDASDFKQQVLQCQLELQGLVDKGVVVKEEEETAEVKSEGEDFEYLVHLNEDVKSEIFDPLPSGDELNTEAQNIETLDKESSVSNIGKADPLLEHEDTDLSCVTKKKCMSANRLKKVNTCLKCGRHFARKQNFLKHQATHRKNDDTCDVCNKQFNNKSLLVAHQRIHSKSYKCHLCDKRYSNRVTRDRHQFEHTGEKTHDCNECGMKFRDLNYLHKHKLTHRGRSCYVCDMCDAKFLCRNTLITHLGKKHQGIKFFRCKLCPERFYGYHALRIHSEIHAEKTYKCNECHKVFFHKPGLADHMRTHTRTREKLYSCDYCGKMFASRYLINRHKRIHTEEMPFCCDICHKSFRYKHSLSGHQLIHTGEKPHCCEVCGKQFARKDSLRTHLKIHVVGVRYSCELCTKSYPTKEGLRQHSRTHKSIPKVSKNQGKRKKNTDKQKDKSIKSVNLV